MLALLLLLYAAVGDRWSWQFALNSFAAYWFLPLPLLAAVALGLRRWDLGVWVLMGALAWAYLFGRQFVPRPVPAVAGPSVRVLTTNVLGFNNDTEAVVAAIRAAEADIVAIQELNTANAAALERELGEVYPYRIMDQREGVTGSGLLSRYPLELLGHLPGRWLGTTHVVRLSVDGRPLTFIRFHAYSGITRLAEREQASRALADFAARNPGPLIAVGDLNATPTSTPHRLITRQLTDAWQAAGWGLGHTFPGAASPGSSRPRFFGVLVPQWLIRIDYIFHSDDLATLSAQIGPWDGVSDHRPVLAEVAWKQ